VGVPSGLLPEEWNCRSLGFARDDKGEGGFSGWHWLQGSPRSQTRDLGHPSIVSDAATHPAAFAASLLTASLIASDYTLFQRVG
jgi:hypothetical protein